MTQSTIEARTESPLRINYNSYGLTSLVDLPNDLGIEREKRRRIAERAHPKYAFLGPLGPDGTLESVQRVLTLQQDAFGLSGYLTPWEPTSGPLFDGILKVYSTDLGARMKREDPSDTRSDTLQRGISEIATHLSLPENARWTRSAALNLLFSIGLTRLGDAPFFELPPVLDYLYGVCIPLAEQMPNPRLVIYEEEDPTRVIREFHQSITNGRYKLGLRRSDVHETPWGKDIVNEPLKLNYHGTRSTAELIDYPQKVLKTPGEESFLVYGQYLALMANGLERSKKDHLHVANFATVALLLAETFAGSGAMERARDYLDLAEEGFGVAQILAEASATKNDKATLLGNIEERMRGLRKLRTLAIGFSSDEWNTGLDENMANLLRTQLS